MTKLYPRPYMDIIADLYKSLLRLQHMMLEHHAASNVREIDVTIAHVLALRAELTLSLHDAILSEAMYSVVYRCALRPSLHAFIYTIEYFSHEVRRSGQAAISRNA